MMSQSPTPRSVAVIGAGSAGTTAAARLRELLGKEARIVVHERADTAGGRAHDIAFAGTRVEIGGSILHSSGELVRSLMELTGAREGQSGLSIDGADETYGFWTEESFPVRTHTSLASMASGILRHVGVRSALGVTRSARTMARRFEGIYALQKRGNAYPTPRELLEALGLGGETDVSLRDALRSRGVSARMVDDVVEAIVHNMYNQGADINALAGEVGLAGAGLSGGYLFSIEGGNGSLFTRVLDAIHAEVHTASAVTRIEGVPGRLTVHSTPATTSSLERAEGNGTADEDGRITSSEVFDAVVIAAPLALADLEVDVEGLDPLPVHPYQQVHTTLVVGEPDPTFFGLNPGERVPSTVFTADSAGAPFMSFGVTGWSPTHGERIHKIFSADTPVTDETLHRVFRAVTEVTRFTWRGAYPVLTPGLDHLPFRLAPGLGYACALETAAGSIEVEAVAGHNTGTLIARDLLGA